jgi:hypothetical protein
VTIAGNVVVHNDQAYDTSLPPDSACPSSLTDADDCGEAIHLLGVSWSTVTNPLYLYTPPAALRTVPRGPASGAG